MCQSRLDSCQPSNSLDPERNEVGLWRSLDLLRSFILAPYRGSKSSLIPRDSVPAPPNAPEAHAPLRSVPGTMTFTSNCESSRPGTFRKTRPLHAKVIESFTKEQMLSFRRDNGRHDEVETLGTLLIREPMLHEKRDRNRYTKKSQLPRSGST